MEIKYEKATIDKRLSESELKQCFVVLHGSIDEVKKSFIFRVSLDIVDCVDKDILEKFFENLFVRVAERESK